MNRRSPLALLFVFVLAAGCSSDDPAPPDAGAIDALAVDAPLAICGNGVCEPDEPTTCAGDCPVCGNHVCELNEPTACPGDCTICGNHVCELGEPAACPADCATCGNHVCEVDETTTCAADCATCGNHVCEVDEATTCATDCTICGNQVCEVDEATTCPADCTCGNHVCDADETTTCPADCTCGDHVCDADETTSCPTDCPATLTMRNMSSYTLFNLYVRSCAATSWGPDLLPLTVSPGQSFTLTSIPPGCYNFRAEGTASTFWQTASPVTLAPSQVYVWTIVN